MACALLCSSAVRVHVSHAYRNTYMESDRISLILDRRVLFSYFHIDFSLASVAVVLAILEMISGLDPSAVTTEPRYLKLDIVSNLCKPHVDLCKPHVDLCKPHVDLCKPVLVALS